MFYKPYSEALIEGGREDMIFAISFLTVVCRKIVLLSSFVRCLFEYVFLFPIVLPVGAK